MNKTPTQPETNDNEIDNEMIADWEKSDRSHRLEIAIEKERQRETARSINRQAAAMQAKEREQQTPTQPNASRPAEVTLTKDDATELWHIIKTRGHSQTRVKLLNALRIIDSQLADLIDKQDNQ